MKTTKNLINLIGLQRFGCHAVGNWLLYQTKILDEYYPLVTLPNEIEEQNDVSGFKLKDRRDPIYSWFLLYNQYWFKYQEPHAPTKLGYTPKEDVETAVIVYEVGELKRYNVDFDNKKEVFGKIENEYNVIVLRDLLNGCASWYAQHGEVPQHIILFWYNRIREITLKTDYIPNKHFINYNKWFSYQSYRRQICADLGLNFTDIAINIIPKFGNGSSFTKMKFNGSAQIMDVHNRWKKYLSDKNFVKIMKQYSHLIPFSEMIFGEYDEDSYIFSNAR